MATFVRFRCPGNPHGVFSAAGELLSTGSPSRRDRARLERMLTWFDTHLRVPRRFVRTTSKGFYRRKRVAVCWFKDDAKRFVRRLWVMARLLERNGVIVEFTWTRYPGYVTYEDGHQIAAIPFSDR